MIEAGQTLQEIEARYQPDRVFNGKLQSYVFGFDTYLGVQVPVKMIHSTVIVVFEGQEFSYGHLEPGHEPTTRFRKSP